MTCFSSGFFGFYSETYLDKFSFCKRSGPSIIFKLKCAKTVIIEMNQWYVMLIFKSISAYSKTCVKWPLSKRQKIGFQDQLSLNAGQKYRRMLQGEHPAILSTFIKLPFVIKIFVLSIFEWSFYTGLTVLSLY